MNNSKFPCPCCAFLTLSEAPPGTFEICPVCFWEDDPVAFADPKFEGGANHISLEQAREKFLKIGAVLPEFKGKVRVPYPEECP